ncbi:Centrosomal protein of 131 kDa [Frankliniella fusca]|uniref:Centrosomal protein of 131 kDa n=1 Tax=Frankliniella fusca TaxID=407009 RepID=A0AAE1GX51_9NEOP|nr:Centrosomal protein of 131 kDa [Frankliniella fusca]
MTHQVCVIISPVTPQGVSLVSRSRSVMGKASIRALSVSGPRVRRPMSALPTMRFTEITCDKRRPYSADSQMLLSSYHQKRNKLSTCFSMSADPMGLAPNDFETDGDVEFSSSTLISSHLSDQLGGAWIELETRGLYLGRPDPSHTTSSTDNGSDLLCCSDVSEEHTSEKSLGKQIQAMARIQHDLQHDDAVYDCSNSFLPKHLDEISTTQKLVSEEDPKKMTTRELHQRMVESGLLFSSAPYGSSQTLKAENNFKKIENTNQPGLVERDEFQQKNNTSPEDDVSKTNPASGFWSQHHSFYQSINKSTSCSIDQISFPKEHDVDSLEGDSSCSNNGSDSQRRNRNSSALPDHVELMSNLSNRNQWSKSEFGQVRFQQWMTDHNRMSSSSSSRDLSPSFFCGMRNTNLQDSKSEIYQDCTVEEISTDSECSKTLQSASARLDKMSKFDESGTNSANCHPEKEEQVIPCSQNCHAESARENQSHYINKNENASAQSEVILFNDSTNSNQFVPSKDILSHDSKVSSPHSNPQDSSVDLDKIGEQNQCDKKNKPAKSTCSSKPTLYPAGKMKTSANNVKKDQMLTALKRKNDISGSISNRRLSKSPSSTSSRNFNPPKEETFPAESQTELVSWMTMCSEELKEKNAKGESSHQTEVLTDAEKSAEDSPYNEIMTILRVLEEKEDESSLLKILNKRPDLKMAEDFSMISKPQIDEQPCNSSSSFTLPAKLEEAAFLNSSKIDPSENKDNYENPPNPALLPCPSDSSTPQPSVQGELRDLLTFLDAVDQSCSSVLQPRHHPSPRTSPGPQPAPAESQHLEELLLLGRTELAQEIVSLRLAIEDRDATINLLRTALREQKDAQARRNAAHSAEMENRISQVKSECEAVIKRHQKFIDQLIADKTSLSKRCETLVQDAKECEEKHAKAITNLEEKHKVEMQRVKDITAATEKLKRERWVENKTQKIKELTVRGLEPELTRLTSQHEQEMSALRTLHAQELEQMEVRAARRASQQMETLREQLVQEKEDALARERDMLRQRMEKQQLLFEEEGAEQRRRLVAEVRREQDRLATLEARLEAQFEERKRGLEREAEQERDRLRRDYADKLNEMHRKQQNEMLQYREVVKAEKEAWMETYQQQQKQSLVQTTNEIRDQLKRERDREIEVVIERLENEATISREEKEKLAENRLKRVREQLTLELRDVETALNSLKEKHIELRAQLQEKEDKLVSSEALNRSLQTQLVETRKARFNQLSAERADLKQSLLAEVNSEMDCLRQQLSEQHSRHQQQLQILSEQSERERQTHQQELQQLFDRVKLAISKKEEVVKVAKAKQKAAEEQNSHLQALLDHRRKESLLS